jgi:hypothetical protein
MIWKDCGYLTLTKDRKKVSVVIKKVRYIAKLEEGSSCSSGEKIKLYPNQPTVVTA